LLRLIGGGNQIRRLLVRDGDEVLLEEIEEGFHEGEFEGEVSTILAELKERWVLVHDELHGFIVFEDEV
jgi:hypothetical protein